MVLKIFACRPFLSKVSSPNLCVMKTYIVPIDFSETSVHAAEFAALLSNQTDVSAIFLLHSYHVSVYESVLPTPDMIMPSEEEIEQQALERKNKLEHIRVGMHTQARRG